MKATKTSTSAQKVFTLVVWLVVGMLIFLPIPTRISAEDSTETGLQYPSGEEVLGARGEYSKTFRKNGQDTIFLSSTPLHYYDETSQDWTEIDTNLETQTQELDTENTPYGFRCLSNSSKIFLPRYGNGWVQLRSGASRLGFKLISDRQRLFQRRGKSALSFTDLLSGCDTTLEAKPGGIKEDIIIKTRSAVPREFVYRIRLSNLVASQTESGEILFKDFQGKTVFQVPKPFMYDLNKIVSEDIQTELIQQGDEYRLTLTPSPSFMNAPERIYPIVIDPTIIDISLNGQAHGTGHSLTYYMPTYSFVAEDGSNIPATKGNSYYEIFNHDGGVFPYKVQITYHAHSQGGAYYWGDPIPGRFRIHLWNPINDQAGEQIFSKEFPNSGGSFKGDFILPAGTAARFILTNPTFYRTLWFDPWSGNCSLTIHCQKESMSPQATWLDPLAPETPNTKVTLRWPEAVDEWNEEACKLPQYVNNPLVRLLEKASGIAGYRVQYSESSSFANPVFYPPIGSAQLPAGTTQCTITGLTVGKQYYFRAVAYDWENNPTNFDPWSPGSSGNPGNPSISVKIRRKLKVNVEYLYIFNLWRYSNETTSNS